MISGIDLDHVAVALERWEDGFPRYGGDLAGAWVAGGEGPGFASCQLRYRNGMKLELLAPHDVGATDFLRRYLDSNGPSPHHLTFKVADIAAALGEVEAAGYHPVGVNLSDPSWKEAFLHPKELPGIVVQLAQSDGDWRTDAPHGFPRPRTTEPAELVHVAHAVASIDEGIELFVDLLAAEVVGEGRWRAWRAVDVAWPGPGRVRLIAGDDAAGHAALEPWLDGRRGRVHHLAFVADEPEGITGAEPDGDLWSIEPERNLGVRVVVAPQGDVLRLDREG